MSDLIKQILFMANSAVARGDALGPIEFWFNRYQTLIGAMVALVAAIGAAAIAWCAVQRQIKAAAELVKRQRNDAAIAKLNDYEVAFRECRIAHVEMTNFNTTFEERSTASLRLKSLVESPRVTGAMNDLIIGRDGDAVYILLMVLKGCTPSRDDSNPTGSFDDIISELWSRMMDGFANRKAYLARGREIEDLYDMRIVDAVRFQKAITDRTQELRRR